MTREKPSYPAASYPAPASRDDAPIRAYYAQALEHAKARRPMIDVRSPGEYRGEITHMPEYPQEGVLRGGHVPGARSVPWKTAANDDGTFKSKAELSKIYTENLGLKPNDDIVAYCRIGERSSHTWFVLTYLLGYSNVRNYDGSWTEWGNMVRSPIAKGAEPG
jgi:thiosulfate/3-mercaptopyruvate sulfurtransferase